MKSINSAKPLIDGIGTATRVGVSMIHLLPGLKLILFTCLQHNGAGGIPDALRFLATGGTELALTQVEIGGGKTSLLEVDRKCTTCVAWMDAVNGWKEMFRPILRNGVREVRMNCLSG